MFNVACVYAYSQASHDPKLFFFFFFFFFTKVLKPGPVAAGSPHIFKSPSVCLDCHLIVTRARVAYYYCCKIKKNKNN